jgi:alcohol dehydrogenase YqhD (iron-dependent ADH family)
VIFSRESYQELAKICRYEKVLLLYGRQAVKDSGIYDQITEVFDKNRIPFEEYGGITERSYQIYEEAIRICQREKITCVVGAGGAMVMDAAKIIAFGAKHANLNCYLSTRISGANDEKLGIVLIPTYPSSGSETDGLADARTQDGHEGRLRGIYADYALLDPELTCSLNKLNTAYSAMVTFIQASVNYFDNDNELAKGFTKTVLKTVLDSYQILLKRPDDLDARSNIMWASAVTTMGILDCGRNSRYPISIYTVGDIPCTLYHVSYREGVTLMYPYWLKYMSRYHLEDIKNFCIDILDIDACLSSQDIIQKGFEEIKRLMKMGDIPTSSAVYGKAADSCINENIKEDLNFSKEELFAMVRESAEEN